MFASLSFVSVAHNLIGSFDRFGDTALHCCVRENLVDIARVVIEADVDVNAKNRYGHTAFQNKAFENKFLERHPKCYAQFVKFLYYFLAM